MSFWDGLFSGAMLVSERVFTPPYDLDYTSLCEVKCSKYLGLLHLSYMSLWETKDCALKGSERTETTKTYEASSIAKTVSHANAQVEMVTLLHAGNGSEPHTLQGSQGSSQERSHNGCQDQGAAQG